MSVLSSRTWQRVLLTAVVSTASACGPGRRPAASPPVPRPETLEPAVVDSLPSASEILRAAGLIVPDSGALPFVATVRFLAGPVPDSTLVMVGVSLSNRALTFAPLGTRRRAAYAITIDVTQQNRRVAHVQSVDTVEVASFREATRGGESILFRRYVPVAPGSYEFMLAVRDEGEMHQALQRIHLTVPRFVSGTLSSPITVYRGTPRFSPDSLPQLIPNVRSTVIFGRDSTMPIYLEGYGLRADARLVVSVVNKDMATLWSDTLSLPQRGQLSNAILDLPVPDLGIGHATVRASLVGTTDTVQTPVFVTFGERWTIGSFDEMLSLLRYFAAASKLAALRDVSPRDRAHLWAAFLRETDPNPRTPQHEALEAYFDRLARANDTFHEREGPGWLTDRGRVLATLGEPDQVLQEAFTGGLPSNRSSVQTWVYSRYGLRLVFSNQAGSRRWRLQPQSETQFETVAEQVRAH